MTWSRHAPRRPRVRAFLLVRPAWMYTCGCKLRCELAAASWLQRAKSLRVIAKARGARVLSQRYLQAVLGHIDAHKQGGYGFVCHRPSLQKYEVNVRLLRGSIASQQLFGLRDRRSAVHAAYSPAGCTRLPEGYQAVGNFPKPCPEHRGLEDARVVVRACGRV